MNSMAVGVQTPRISLSSSLVKPAPLPAEQTHVSSVALPSALRTHVSAVERFDYYAAWSTLTFQSSDKNHDEVGVGVQLGGVSDTVVDLFTSGIKSNHEP